MLTSGSSKARAPNRVIWRVHELSSGTGAGGAGTVTGAGAGIGAGAGTGAGTSEEAVADSGNSPANPAGIPTLASLFVRKKM